MKRFLRMPLRYRFVLSSTFLIVLLMILVTLIVENRQRETFFSEAKKRGESIARNLAAVSMGYLVSYNYIALKQNAERVTGEDVVYVIILDKEGNVAAYSGRDDLQGKKLTDPVSLKAATAKGLLLQEAFYKEKGVRVLDISYPVFMENSGQRWGVIRVGLSLEGMYADIRYTRGLLAFIAAFAILLGYGGSVFLARKITKPLEELVGATVEVAKGNLEHRIHLSTGDEIEELARNFNRMVDEILQHRKELEARLAEIASLKRYTDYVLASMSNGLLTVDREGVIVTVNRGCEEIIGVRKEEMVGKVFTTCFKDNPEFCKAIEDAVGGNGSKRLEVSYRKGEEELILAFSATPLVDTEDKRIGTLVIFEDLTEIKALEERMRHADRLAAVGVIAASLAHDIQNPLTAIKTFVQLLPERADNPAFIERFNRTVPREVNRLSTIIENLLDLARKPRLTLTSVNLNDILQKTIELYTVEFDQRGVEVDFDPDPDLLHIKGDPEYLTRVFSNLLVNAFQAMPDGGRISISTGVGEGKVFARISDTGVGMSEETAKNLFNPFYTTKERGTGLGLVTVKNIVEEHKGEITVESAPGKGTTFTIYFPAENIPTLEHRV